MRSVFIAALALALGGCLQQTSARASSAASCNASVSGVWAANGADYVIEAVSMGPDCRRAVATIVVRDDEGVLWTQAYPTARVMTLAGAEDAPGMRAALSEWIDRSNRTYASSSALPDWPEGAQGPVSGEFPFYVADLRREDYVALRQRDVPVFCYVQGMESLNCLALEHGALTEIGVQTFPG